MSTPERIQDLITALSSIEGATVKTDGPTIGNCWFIDVVKRHHDNMFGGSRWVCVQAVDDENEDYDFGFSLIDDNTGFSDRPDCICSHIPTLVKYVSLLLSC